MVVPLSVGPDDPDMDYGRSVPFSLAPPSREMVEAFALSPQAPISGKREREVVNYRSTLNDCLLGFFPDPLLLQDPPTQPVRCKPRVILSLSLVIAQAGVIPFFRDQPDKPHLSGLAPVKGE